jgi:DNA helicase-2/ATP-dependent DNA helicase PcrA
MKENKFLTYMNLLDDRYIEEADPAASAAPAFAVGTKVRHAIFGEGEILSARPMGGDMLYEVRFAGGNVKKLMGTYAKLQKI